MHARDTASNTSSAKFLWQRTRSSFLALNVTETDEIAYLKKEEERKRKREKKISDTEAYRGVGGEGRQEGTFVW